MSSNRLMHVVLLFVLVPVAGAPARTLEVKQGRSAIVKVAPNGIAEHVTRLPAGTRVEHVGDAPLFYAVRAPTQTV